MGYHAELTDSKFFISGEDKFKAYKALKAALNLKGVRCLEEALECFGFFSETDAEDNIYDINYDCDKLGFNEEAMFECIAPFVKSGSFLEMCGEDGEHWRWVFSDGKFKTIRAKITWDDDDEE